MQYNYFFTILSVILTGTSWAQLAVVNDYKALYSVNTGNVVGNILANDYLNNSPVLPSDVTLTQTIPNAFLSLQPDGSVVALQNMSEGSKFLYYEICETANPNNCTSGYFWLNIPWEPGFTEPQATILEQPTCDYPFAKIRFDNFPFGPEYPWFFTYWNDNGLRHTEYTSSSYIAENIPPGVLHYGLEDGMDGIIRTGSGIYVPYPECGNLSFSFDGVVTDTNGNGVTDPGDTIHYPFLITNNGSDAMTNITVTSPTLNVHGGPLLSLAPGASDNTTFFADYVLTQNDINANIVRHLGSFSASSGSGTVAANYEDTTTLGLPDGIRMSVFIDWNSNGIMDGNESFTNPALAGTFTYETNNDGNIHHVVTSNTAFTLYESNPTVSYHLGMIINPLFADYYEINTQYTATVAPGSGITTYTFALTAIPFTDASVYLVAEAIRPGTSISQKLLVRNYGNTAIASGTVTYTRDSRMTITSVSETVTNTPTGFTYNFTNLTAGEQRIIDITLMSAIPPQLNIGDQVVTQAAVTALPNDSYPENNQLLRSQAVINSWDPNDISECHGPEILHSSFSSDDFLTYTIRFENTGDADAINIKVTDLLDGQLDETTIRMVGASHNYTMERVGHTLSWHFNGIHLDPSVADSNIGKGYIMFDIKPKPGYAVGDVIPNQANIYFDFNPAVATNIFETEFVSVLSANAFESGIISVYPNPTDHVVNIRSLQSIKTAKVYDILGKQLMEQTVNSADAQLDLSALRKGLYLVKLLGETETTIKVVRK